MLFFLDLLMLVSSNSIFIGICAIAMEIQLSRRYAVIYNNKAHKIVIFDFCPECHQEWDSQVSKLTSTEHNIYTPHWFPDIESLFPLNGILRTVSRYVKNKGFHIYINVTRGRNTFRSTFKALYLRHGNCSFNSCLGQGLLSSL